MPSFMDFYEGQIYRPPSEANSLILQITTGCSYNRCVYCSMFKPKQHRIRPLSEIRKALAVFRDHYGPVKRIFLADGDAMAIPASDLVEIFDSVNEYFPECERISTYGSCRNLSGYTTGDLEELKKRGLGLIYLGIESGSDRILKKVKKGQNRKMILEAAEKLRSAEIRLSATVICGLGGRELAVENAVQTAEVLNRIDPDYLGLLRLTVDPGTEMERMVRDGEFSPQSESGIIQEMHELISQLELSDCIVRSNHVCNYVSIAGTLGRDKKRMLDQLKFALESTPGGAQGS